MLVASLSTHNIHLYRNNDTALTVIEPAKIDWYTVGDNGEVNNFTLKNTDGDLKFIQYQHINSADAYKYTYVEVLNASPEQEIYKEHGMTYRTGYALVFIFFDAK